MMKMQEDDAKRICSAECIDWNRLKGSTIFISGGTGLIGTTLVNALLYANEAKNLDLTIICLVRDIEKAQSRFSGKPILRTDSIDRELNIDHKIDYIIHAANPTASAYFISNPVETIQTAVQSTMQLLQLAKRNSAKGFVYLSSMEVYGHPAKGHRVKEPEVAGFDTAIVRNCYPISKQLCESLCKAYASEYGLPANVVRLTQTFGPGVAYDDGRVFAQFMRSALEGKDIVLHTAGTTERCYLYTADAVEAILTVMTRGTQGEMYTAANPETYCSILDMAKMVAHDIARDAIQVRIEMDDVDHGYANELFMQLDVSKLERLGWRPSVDLAEMYKRMMQSFQ